MTCLSQKNLHIDLHFIVHAYRIYDVAYALKCRCVGDRRTGETRSEGRHEVCDACAWTLQGRKKQRGFERCTAARRWMAELYGGYVGCDVRGLWEAAFVKEEKWGVRWGCCVRFVEDRVVVRVEMDEWERHNIRRCSRVRVIANAEQTSLPMSAFVGWMAMRCEGGDGGLCICKEVSRGYLHQMQTQMQERRKRNVLAPERMFPISSLTGIVGMTLEKG